MHEVFDELGFFAGEYVEHVVQHQHLARAIRACADADGGDAQGRGHAAAQRGGDGFEHHHARACFFDQLGVFQQTLGITLVAALHFVAAELMHALRRQPQMRAHRYAALHEIGNGVGDRLAAFQLHHLCARSHDFGRVAKSLRRA